MTICKESVENGQISHPLGVDPPDDNSLSLHQTPPRENCDIFSGERRLDGFPVRTGSPRTLFSPQPIAGFPEEHAAANLLCYNFLTSIKHDELHRSQIVLAYGFPQRYRLLSGLSDVPIEQQISGVLEFCKALLFGEWNQTSGQCQRGIGGTEGRLPHLLRHRVCFRSLTSKSAEGERNAIRHF